MAYNIVSEDITHIVNSGLPWEKFQGKTVLITGAAGALPSYMVKTLLCFNDTVDPAKKCHVIGLVRSRVNAEALFQSYLNRSDFTLIAQDVCIPVIPGRDVHFIIHAASQASPKYYGTDPVGTINANVLGTHHLLSLAHQHKVESFLFFSTSEVYGAVPHSASIAETDYGTLDPTLVRSCYGESKRLGETMCAAWSHQYGVPAKIVRPFHTYGPGFKSDDGRVFADFVTNIVEGKDIVIHSDGSAVRSFCYIADATEAFFTVLLKGENGQAYNVGNPDATASVKSLAELLTGLFPEKALHVIFKHQGNAGGYIPSTVSSVLPDITRIRELGWNPGTTLAQGFTRTIDSYAD
jgi:UDP-glucuronate decarboxylase